MSSGSALTTLPAAEVSAVNFWRRFLDSPPTDSAATKEFFMKKLFPLWVFSCLLLTLPALAQTHGFYWSSSGGLQDIETLDLNCCSPCNSCARGINRAGQVVGA
jgi:hypothetical protein